MAHEGLVPHEGSGTIDSSLTVDASDLPNIVEADA